MVDFDFGLQFDFDEKTDVTYYVDVVMCIDATGSMDPLLDEVRNTALTLNDRFMEAMEASGKHADQFRVKVVVFRDYMVDSEPMTASDFYVLPEQKSEFKNYLDAIEATGGGDEPENGLEAIATALQSDWVRKGEKQRHVVLMFTDASALELGARKGCPNYPDNLPQTFADLTDMWSCSSQFFTTTFKPEAARMILFVPNKEPWSRIDKSMDQVWVHYSNETGLKNINMNEIIDVLVASI